MQRDTRGNSQYSSISYILKGSQTACINRIYVQIEQLQAVKIFKLDRYFVQNTYIELHEFLACSAVLIKLV